MKIRMRIRERCNALGITNASQLADRAKLTAPTAYRAYNNDIKQLTITTLEKLCNALDCSPGDLLVRIGGKSRKARTGKKVSDKH
ncbi:MAG: Cro/C1-type DNA-binding domain [Acidobacteriota bacterium]|jgi:putative transcriptional regulator|nr:Cro/C1-type DNA-binding domain [Acidobacteriota bacterium]